MNSWIHHSAFKMMNSWPIIFHLYPHSLSPSVLFWKTQIPDIIIFYLKQDASLYPWVKEQITMKIRKIFLTECKENILKLMVLLVLPKMACPITCYSLTLPGKTLDRIQQTKTVKGEESILTRDFGSWGMTLLWVPWALFFFFFACHIYLEKMVEKSATWNHQ